MKRSLFISLSFFIAAISLVFLSFSSQALAAIDCTPSPESGVYKKPLPLPNGSAITAPLLLNTIFNINCVDSEDKVPSFSDTVKITVSVDATCSVAPLSITAGESATWSVSNEKGGDGSYTYSWSGTDGLSGTSRSITKTYGSPGAKTASVTVYSKNVNGSSINKVVQCDSDPGSGTDRDPIIVNNPFDYSLSNAGDKTVVAGQSVSNTITRTLAAGVPAEASQDVTLSIGPLPNGMVSPDVADPSFTLNPSKPTSQSTLTLNTTLGKTCTGSPAPASCAYLVTVNGSPLNKTTSFVLTVTNPSYTLSLTRTGNGTVSSSPAGISCGTGCPSANASYIYNTPVTLTASPDSGWTVSSANWTGCASTANTQDGKSTCSVAMSQARSVSVSFNQLNASADLKVNGADSATLSYNSGSYFTWSTSNMVANSCSITSDRSLAGYPKTGLPTSHSGVSYPTGSLTSDTVFTLTCTKISGTGGGNTDQAPVKILPQQPVLSGTAGACGGNITLTWPAASLAQSYKLHRSSTGSPGSFSQLPIGSPSAAVSPYSDSNLTVNGAYYYQVEAVNSAGSSYSGIKSVTASDACFDYSLSNGGDKTVVAGQSVTNTITKTLLAGATVPVKVSIKPVSSSDSSPLLPSGVTATFSTPNPSNPTATHTLTLQTRLGTLAEGGTQPGAYLITVVGDVGDKSTSFVLTVTNPSYQLTVTTSGTGSGTVTSSGVTPTINCTRSLAGATSGTCNGSYTLNTSIILSGNEAEGSTFGGWSGACANASGSCTVLVNGAKTVDAKFDQQNTSIALIATSPVAYGAASTLNWSSENMVAGSCKIESSRPVSGFPKNNQAVNGSVSTGPLTADTNFTLSCTKKTGTSGPDSATALVKVGPEQPAITLNSSSASCGGNINLSYGGGDGGTSFTLYRKADSDTSPYDFIQSAGTLGALRTADTGLTYGRTFFYQVMATKTHSDGTQTTSYSIRPKSAAASADCTLTASLVADPNSGPAALETTLKATAGGDMTGTPSYRFKCRSTDTAWSASQSGSTFACTYGSQGSYTAEVEITRGGKTAEASAAVSVSAAPSVDLKVEGSDAPANDPFKAGLDQNLNLTWTGNSLKNNSCETSWKGGKRPAENTSGDSVKANHTDSSYSITCDRSNGGKATDTVYVNVGPGKPGIDAATGECGGVIDLEYTAGTGATSYKLHRQPFSATDSGWGMIASANSINGLPGSQTGLSYSTEYSYQLEAIRSGVSNNSEIDKANSSSRCIIAPNLDLRINNKESNVQLRFEEQGIITWTQRNGIDPEDPPRCTASGSSEWSGSKNPEGSQPTQSGNCVSPRTYFLTCQNDAGNSSDDVDVTITGAPDSDYSIGANPTSGFMRFYGPKATSGPFVITIAATDMCDEDAGKNIRLDFSLEKDGREVRNGITITPQSTTLTPAQFALGVSVKVEAATLLDEGNYELVVKANRIKKNKEARIPIRVIIVNPVFDEI